jgi:hypothetical protein
MKTTLKILLISAGIIEDNKQVYGSVIVLDEGISNQIDNDRIEVGQKHAKVSISTINNNQLARDLAYSGLVPGHVSVEVQTTVKKGVMTMEIVSFDSKKVAA